MKSYFWLMVLGLLLDCTLAVGEERGKTWQRHAIDQSSRGADGVRLADVNGDGKLDIATGWEEGRQVRAYLNPGPKKSKSLWPAVTVGQVHSAEDAVFADVDGDGAFDVVSCCEGKERSVFIHWAPPNAENYQTPTAWQTEAIPVAEKAKMWMFCLPMELDGKPGVELIAGAKGKEAQVGWFESGPNRRDLHQWRWHAIYEAGWIMSLIARDVDGDGDQDVILTDRKGKNQGCKWLENPGPGPKQKQLWKEHAIGGIDQEVMFLGAGDVDQDGREDFAVAVRGGAVLVFHRTSEKRPAWETVEVPMPSETGTGKGAGIGDVDGDGLPDFVITCENAKGTSGVFWLKQEKSDAFNNAKWTAREISGKTEGVKFDLVELIDMDGDGDLDVLTCEERDNLGVIWYENPTKNVTLK